MRRQRCLPARWTNTQCGTCSWSLRSDECSHLSCCMREKDGPEIPLHSGTCLTLPPSTCGAWLCIKPHDSATAFSHPLLPRGIMSEDVLPIAPPTGLPQLGGVGESWPNCHPNLPRHLPTVFARWPPSISTNLHRGLRRNFVCCLVGPPSPCSWPSRMRNASNNHAPCTS